ncbi:MAG: hypothetical protein N3A66_07475, partial [Planctomycetota bacterium]|nr:hypothetical protein [Planctomycetota bacterium]
MMRAKIACHLILLFAMAGAAEAGEASRNSAGRFRWRWVYAPVNFQVDKDVEVLLALMPRAKAAGYNGMLIADYKFGRLAGRPDNYYQNLGRAKAAAEKLDLAIIPAVMPVGYSNSILQNDPNLAEGILVRDAPFRAHRGNATLIENALLACDFESGQAPWAFDWIDGPGKSSFLDTEVRHSGKAALRL